MASLRRLRARPASAGRGRPRPRAPAVAGGDLVADRGDQRAGRVGQLGDGADGRDQAGRPVVERVVGDRERCGRARTDRAQVVQVVLAVVPADQHLEHRLRAGHAGLEPLGEEPDDLLRDRGQRVDPLGAVGGVGVGGERSDLVADAGQDARRARRRPAAGRTSGSGCCGPGRRPPGTAAGWHRTSRSRSSRAGPAQLLAPAAARRSSAGAARSTRRTSGAERCWARKIRNTASSSCGRPVQVGDAVVGEHRGQPVAELLGQAAALDVEALQVGVEVLRGLCTRSSVCSSSPAGRLRLSSARSANRPSSVELVGARTSAPAATSSSRAAR